MILFPLLAIAATQTPAADTAWGKADRGLNIGLSIEQRKDGPPIIRCYAMNDNEVAIIITTKGFTMPPPVPTFFLKNNHEGAWQFTPASAHPLVTDGFAWEILVPSHMPTLIYASRNYFPMTAGTYEITAHYSAMRRPSQSGKSVPVEMTLESAETTITIRAADVQPASAAGSG